MRSTIRLHDVARACALFYAHTCPMRTMMIDKPKHRAERWTAFNLVAGQARHVYANMADRGHPFACASCVVFFASVCMCIMSSPLMRFMSIEFTSCYTYRHTHCCAKCAWFMWSAPNRLQHGDRCFEDRVHNANVHRSVPDP